jgi:hypothetical protein
MSWQDNIENIVFSITTGDGLNYTPKWKNATKEVEYNASVFEFVNVDGSLVIRQKPKGRRFELEFYFDGENSIIQGNNFEISARDSRIWTVKHPIYGDFKCQPLNLKQDNSILNVSKFNVSVVETITDKYPDYTPVIEDEIIEQIAVTNENQAQALADSKELDKNELTENVTALDTALSKIIKSSEDLKAFKNLVSDSVIEIQNVSSTGLSILRSMQALINYPATIVQTIESRFNAFEEAFDNLANSFTTNKNQFEAIAGSLIAAMQLASSTNIGSEYETRTKVLLQQNRLIEKYNEYITFLDSLQTERADSDDSYIPNYSGISSLNVLVNLSISNLFEIAFNAKQEREYTLLEDSNVVLLTHKFYGLDKNDVNLDKFISSNNIGLNELLNIRKGRKVIYYV